MKDVFTCLSGATTADTPALRILYAARARAEIVRFDQELARARELLEQVEAELLRHAGPAQLKLGAR